MRFNFHSGFWIFTACYILAVQQVHLFAKIAADGSQSAAEVLLNDKAMFEPRNAEYAYTMKPAFLLLLLFCTTLINAQNNAVSAGKKMDTIHSAILHEDRYIWVHAPGGTSVASSPVIYILDGQIFFDEVINILSRLSKETGRNIADEVIVVGIGNIQHRYRDYSPTHIASSPWVDSYSASISGGGEKFVSF